MRVSSPSMTAARSNPVISWPRTVAALCLGRMTDAASMKLLTWCDERCGS
jgi:hypothetical protein